MEETISSKALEANLAQTRVEEIDIPEEHQQFMSLSQSHRGIHQRTREFMLEFHHPYSNRPLVVDRWREIVLRDLWFFWFFHRKEAEGDVRGPGENLNEGSSQDREPRHGAGGSSSHPLGVLKGDAFRYELS